MRHRGVWAVIVAASVIVGGLVAPATEARAAPPAPTPVVSGNHLVDSRTGTPWVAHAVNWPSFEYACQQGWAYAQDGRTTTAAQAMVSWGITAVRLPLNEACWLGIEGSPAYGTASGYRAAVASWVSTLNAAGLVVILDLHWTSPPGYPANGQRAMADARSVTFWQQVAGAYASNGSVMFDAFNEPYSRWNDATSSWAFQLTWSCWRDGGCQAPVENDQTGTLSGARYPIAGMSALVQAIRGAGAAQPILLGGLDYANDLRGWLANRPSDTQLVASWHNYPAQRCRTATCWNAEIAPVAAVVPVIATEFGQTDGGNSFLTTFMTWADAHGVGYAPWAWWFTDASDGVAANLYALIDGNFAPKAPSGTAFHDHLASLVTGPVSPITAAYTALGGSAGPLGPATGGIQEIGGGAGQAFRTGYILTHPDRGTWVVWGGIGVAWGSLTAWGPAGFPAGPETCGQPAGGCYQAFEHGRIYWSPLTGARFVPPAVEATLVTAGGVGGWLGYPVTAYTAGLRDGGAYQVFQRGTMYTSAAGTWALHGSIRTTYASVGNEWGPAGYPAGPETCGQPAGGCYQAFEHGRIYWSPLTGAQFVPDPLTAALENSGGLGGWLGYPLAASTAGLRDGGTYQVFQGGTMYSSAVGTWAVHGSIRLVWAGLLNEWGPAGYPAGAETCGLTGGGCFQAFERGRIYWSQAVGVRFVPAAVLTAYQAAGAEAGSYGYPIGDARTAAGVTTQAFQGGTITATA